MDAPLYDVYLTGKLADDVAPELAAQRLAALFKSTPEAMAELITGKVQLLKRGIDKNAALKYRDALQKAGCEVAFKAQTTTTAPAASAPVVQPPPATATAYPAAPAAELQLAAPGEDLLRPNERQAVTVASVETTHLSLAPVGPLPTTTLITAAVPDISYLSLAAAEGNLLEDSEREVPPSIAPDISELRLAEVGTPLETLKNKAEPPHLDISGLNLAPAGSDLLTPNEREHPQPSSLPRTDHITLAP